MPVQKANDAELRWATDPAARQAVLEMCGEQMARYGYNPKDD